MLKIKERYPVRVGHQFDYELENGELLHHSEWNGEVYETENGIFRPVYAPDPEADPDAESFEIVGFEN